MRGRRVRALIAAALSLGLVMAASGADAKPDRGERGHEKRAKQGGGAATATVASADREADQWALGLIDAHEAWQTATGSGVVVAVVDSGVDKEHPEFAGKLVNGASWVCSKGVEVPCDQWDDANGHGTHVAGIVAAERDGAGVTGVAHDAKIMPVRVLDGDGEGSFEAVAEGIRYAAEKGAHVINLSLGNLIPGSSIVLTLTEFDVAVFEAIEYAVGKGSLVVIAAGNSSLPWCDSEALLLGDGVLCVGAVDRFDLPAWYSNSGVDIDVVAPGGSGALVCDWDVLSTWPADAESFCEDTGYEELAGTSMAAPHVAGVGALLMQFGATNTEAARIVVETGESFTGLAPPFDPPRVNAAFAVAAA